MAMTTPNRKRRSTVSVNTTPTVAAGTRVGVVPAALDGERAAPAAREPLRLAPRQRQQDPAGGPVAVPPPGQRAAVAAAQGGGVAPGVQPGQRPGEDHL